MRVRKTGAQRGERVTWYVWADREEERAAVRAGLLEERAPDARWRYVLAWGFGSRGGAVGAMAVMREEVERVVARMQGGGAEWCGRLVLARIFADEARLGAHNTELRGFVRRLEGIAGELREERLGVLAGELGRWVAEGARLYVRLVDTMQMACLLAGARDERQGTGGKGLGN